MENYYIGLDIGTNSVGWAVTDRAYNILKRKGKRMWGIRLFESADTAAERRAFRASRRRLQRRKQRIDLLQELFAEEIHKVDPTFFIRLNESRLHLEDKSVDGRFLLFMDPDYTDIDYYREYPTIFHLRKALIENCAEHDPRHLYLALHHILKNRGHFLINGELSDAKNFDTVFNQLAEVIFDAFHIEIAGGQRSAFETTLRDRNLSGTAKVKDLIKCFEIEGEEYGKAEQKQRKETAENICKLLVGNKGDLKKLFHEEFEGLEKSSFSFGDSAYDDGIRPNIQEVMPEQSYIIDCIKALYDWNILVDILDGEDYISFAKVKQYERHQKNLKDLKKLCRKYLARAEYKKFFDGTEGGVNYAAYIGSVKTKGRKTAVKKCSEEDFYKELEKRLAQISPQEDDKALWDRLLTETKQKTLLPLQRSKDNGVVPHQIHQMELKKILRNAEVYMPFLTKKDEEGKSASEKILAIFSFRVPYYVGPLSDRHKGQGSNSWIVRKEEGRIYPWNFSEKVDEEKSNEAFIRRMTNKCTYLIGEDVIPKNSLLYSRFMVLNELNNLRVRGKKVSVEEKQKLYDELFCKHTKVTGKRLLDYLRRSDEKLTKEDLSGFDQDFKASLSSYLDFEKGVFGAEMAKDSIRTVAEDIIRWKTIYGDDQKMTRHVIEQKYPNLLTEEQYKAVRRLRYTGWGNFSEKFLNGIQGIDQETGAIYTIIQALWETDCNLMQLLSSRFTFAAEIAKLNEAAQGEITSVTYDALVKDLIVSPAVKRAIWQTVQIVEEIRHVIGCDPEKIFVEMARENEERDQNGKGKRKDSRKQQLLALYNACEGDVRDWIEKIEATDERAFNSIKLYLYYTQMGRCMYTGNQIDLEQLMAGNPKWDRDHIYPQSKIKDDSLDNLVLVERDKNAKNSNEMLSSEIQEKQKGRWAQLLKMGLISKKKYDRLTRTGDFTDEELAGFINRQLVETRQSSKAVVELLNRMFRDSRVIQVKAGITSQFRHRDLNVPKSRRINDFHHAKDAYLNIVAGDVYDAKFTSNPRIWLKENKERKYNLSRTFDFDVYRGNTRIWEAPAYNGKKKNEKGEKFGGTLDLVRKIVQRNDILYTEYTYCDKGGLFNATIVKKGKGAPIPLKSGLDTEKYGGYNSANTSYFTLIEFDGKKGERVRNLMEVPIYIANMLPHDPEAYLKYCEQVKHLENVKVLRPCIKKNALLLVDGYPMRIRGANEIIILFKNGMQPLFKQYEILIRNIEKYLDKHQAFEVNERFDRITEEGLIDLYDDMTEKLLTVYEKRPANQGKLLKQNRERFLELSLKKKAALLNGILAMFRCDIETKADLTDIGGSKNSGSMKINKNTVGKSYLILVNQSVTGLYETRTEL